MVLEVFLMKTRRWLSILLSISIIMCLLPTVVAADGASMTWSELQSRITNASDGEVIDLPADGYVVATSNTDECLTVPAGKRITLNLNSSQLNRNCYDPKLKGNIFDVYGDLTITGSGMIMNGASTENGGAFYIAPYGKVTIASSNIEIGYGKTSKNGGCIYVSENASFTLNGGKVSSGSASGYGGAIYVKEGGTFVMNGGTVYGDGQCGSVYVDNASSFSISGDVNISGGLYLAGSSVINVTGELTGYTMGGQYLEIKFYNNPIGVAVSPDHNGIITSSLSPYGTYAKFTSSNSDFEVAETADGEAYLKKLVFYNISVSDSENGSISTTYSKCESGKEFYFDTYPADGYCFTGVKDTITGETLTIIRDGGGYHPDRYWNYIPEHDINLQATFTPISETVIVKAANLTLNGQILINIKLQIPNAIATDPGAKAEISYRGATRQVALSALPREGDLYVVSQPCAVKEFACPVAIKILDGNGDICIMTQDSTKAMCLNKEYVYSWVDGTYMPIPLPDGTIQYHNFNEFTYTIEQYKYAVKNGSDTRLKPLIEALNYYALFTWRFFQKYTNNKVQDHSFVGYEDDIQNSPSWLSKYRAVTADSLIDYKPATTGSVTGITVEDMRLKLDSDTTITIRFRLDASLSQEDIRVMVPNVNPEIERDGNYLTVKIKNVNALNLNKTYTVNVYHGSEHLAFNCSALSYAYLVLSAEDGTFPSSYKDELEFTVRSMKVYSDAAHTYYDN